MKFPRRFALLAAVFAALATPPAAGAATTIDHDIVFGPDRLHVEMRGGHLVLAAPTAAREFRAGRPDLPWFGETVRLPYGVRVTRVEVLSMETQPVADGVKIEAAMLARTSNEMAARSTPDPAYFTTAQVQPAVPVELGLQGYRRGVNEAALSVSPVRWTPTTGHLDRVTRMRVRLTLDSDPSPDVVRRERIVREWEDDPAAISSTRSAAIQSSMGRDIKGRAQPFMAEQLPSVLGSPVEYVIVTSEALRPQYERLAQWKTESGVPAVVRTMEFIRQQYVAGVDDAERVRDFIRDAYSRWGTKWVLLGGDTEIIPVRFGYTSFYGGNSIASDNYYACLDGNWNRDGDNLFGEGYVDPGSPGDSIDLMPEVFVGRAPTTTLTEAQKFIDKVFQYSRTPVGDYEDRVLFFAEVLFPQDYDPGMYIILDGAELVEEVLPSFDPHPEIHTVRLYENYPDTAYRPGALPLSKQAVIDSFSAGYNISVHVGHGYRNTMSVGDESMDNTTATEMSNGNRLTNLYAIDCTSNAIDYPCIGEAFIHCAGGGAVSNIGSTHFDFPTAGRAYQAEYFKLLFRDSVTALGEAFSKQKYPFIPFSNYDGVNRWTQMTLLLLGDPEMHIWTRLPRTLTVSHPATITLGDSTLAVHVQIGAANLINATVTAYRANDDFTSLLTDASGNVTLPFRPDSVGTFTLTVTALNCRPYQANVTINPTGLPLVADPGYSLDDDTSGGTNGNGNGVLDAGETVDVLVPLRNNGGSTAPAVSATLLTSDPVATVTVPTVNYGPIASGGSVVPSTGFRVATPYSAEDQHEIAFTLRLFDGAGRSRTEKFHLTVHSPEIDHFSQTIVDAGGNSNGVPDPGENVSYYVALRNVGTGKAPGVFARLRNYDGLATVTDSVANYGDIPAGTEQAADALVFTPSSTNALVELRIYDQFGLVKTQMLDLQRPSLPFDLACSASATSIKLHWTPNQEADLFGYNIYRSTNPGGPFVKVNPIPTGKISYYHDTGLAPLTPFYYRVTAVDASGNESAQSFVTSASTNPPTHGIFPVQMGGTTPSSVAIDHIYSGFPVALVAGADLLYAWHPDGSTPVDADGAGTSSGDFTTVGKYYAAGPSIADLTGDGIPEIIAPTWTDTSVYVYNRDGTQLTGWPLVTHDAIWSSAAIGDIDNDGSNELFFGSNGNRFYGMRGNGSEWMDGDSNPATKGVFKVLGSVSNYGTPALADLNNDGYLDIVYGSCDGKVYAWNRFGAALPGFPVSLGAAITASVAVAPLDGPGDTDLDIVVATTGDYLYVLDSSGFVRTGFPQYMKLSGTTKTPSPAIADMNNDGYLDIVQASTNGGMYVWDRNGGILSGWAGPRYSSLLTSASESSPVVADINGDGLPDVVMGGEDNTLAALGNNGQMLAGFPIILDGEVRGTPAVCDCDADGLTEIVLAGWDKMLHVWDYDFPYSPNGPPAWPQFHHDARRTGLYTAPLLVDVPETPRTDGAPATIELALPAPNPARLNTRFDYAMPASEAGTTFDLSIFDLSGRRLRTLASGPVRAGRYTATWDLRGNEGEPALTGVYFVRFQVGNDRRTHKLLVVR